MNKAKAEIKNLQAILAIEKEEDRKIHQKLLTRTTIQERTAKGYCWKPLNIKETGYAIGDFPYIIVERTKLLDKPHHFGSGKPVSLFMVNNSEEKEEINGVINFVDKNTMKIIFTVDELPLWVQKSSIGVQLLFDEKSYEEMEKALATIIESENPLLDHLVSTIYGYKDALPIKQIPVGIPALNDSQNAAVGMVLGTPETSAIHGPPGTGKTTTLVQAIRLLAKEETCILVCAPSNAATDLLTEKIASEGIDVVRVGNLSRIDEQVMDHTLDNKVSTHVQAKEIKKMKIKAGEFRRLAGKYKRSFGALEREQRKMLYREARKMMDGAIDAEDSLIENILHNTQVITTTLVGANHKHLKHFRFKTVIIDEAAQALEPACWIPILKAERVIFAGDPFQLPPTIKSEEAKKQGLEVTLIEKVIQRHQKDAITLLDTQYRMNDTIMSFSNQQFYAGQLKAFEANSSISLPEDSEPVEFIDSAGCGFDEKTNPETFSLYNSGEYDVLRKHFDQLRIHCEKGFSVGIISPYKEQVNYIKDHFAEEDLLSLDLTINTIDSFQGQERDIIYISLVRSNENGEIGFLKDFRRMNVALTRAKRKLVVIGDSATLGSEQFYQDFLAYAEKAGGYHSAWEWMS